MIGQANRLTASTSGLGINDSLAKTPARELQPHVLLIAPSWDDASLRARWLLAAEKADRLFLRASENPVFAEKIEPLTSCYWLDLRNAAVTMMMYFNLSSAAAIVPVWDMPWGEEFAVLAQLGFFICRGDRYYLVVPKQLSVRKIKRACLDVVKTELDEILHPEALLTTMSLRDARVAQGQLSTGISATGRSLARSRISADGKCCATCGAEVRDRVPSDTGALAHPKIYCLGSAQIQT
jgi:hypothetical protein